MKSENMLDDLRGSLNKIDVAKYAKLKELESCEFTDDWFDSAVV